jgi:hypothetical protein
MIVALMRMAPVLLPVLAGAIPAFAGGWFAHGLKFDLIDRPAIIREATVRADDACTIRTQAAANRAEQIERARQLAANAEARRIYEAALTNSELLAEAAQTALDKEIADREAILASEGRSCSFTDDDLRWLYDNGPAPAGSGGG